MNKIEVFDFIIAHNREHGGQMTTEKGFKKWFPELYNEFINMDFPDFFINFDFKQKLWHFLKNDYSQHFCKCGNPLKFRAFWYGYNQFCSLNCSAMIENQIECVKEKNESRSEEDKKKISDKITQVFLSKYGVVRYSQTKEWKEKTLKKNNEKFGKDWYSQTDQYKKEYAEACEKKYGEGIINSFQSKEVRDICFKKFYESFLKRHPNVIEIKDNTFVCKCSDKFCNLCNDKIYEIKKQTFSDRNCHNIDTCIIRTPYGCIDSNPEKNLYEYINSIYDGRIIKNDRDVMDGKELDIYLPDMNLAFEFNGVYWHNEFNKPKYYHQDKSVNCMKKNIQLIHIWEDDWNYKNDIVKDIIKSKLKLSSYNIGARKCQIKEVSNKDAFVFLDNYHIQGGVKNGKSIGLYHDDELIEIMTFGSLRKNMGGKPEEGYYEIYRVCSKSGYNVQGGFSKLLKYFEDNYHPIQVITYANLDYSYGNVYLQCGFVSTTLSKPTYTWVVNGIRQYRSNFMKSKLEECRENPDLTESEVMHNRGHWKCWDSGKIKFVKDYK